MWCHQEAPACFIEPSWKAGSRQRDGEPAKKRNCRVTNSRLCLVAQIHNKFFRVCGRSLLTRSSARCQPAVKNLSRQDLHDGVPSSTVLKSRISRESYTSAELSTEFP